MKSELLYHNIVIGICCCIGGDQVQPISEVLSASVCRVEEDVVSISSKTFVPIHQTVASHPRISEF